MLISNKRDFYLSALAGAVASCGMAPIGSICAVLIGYSAYFIVMSRAETAKRAAFLTFVFSFVWHLINVYWIAYPLTINFAKHTCLIPVALVVGPSYLSLFWMVAVYFAKKKFDHSVVMYASVLSLVMYVYGYYMPGFPWCYVGYAWYDHIEMMQLLSLCGIHGVNFITLLMAFSLGQAYLYWLSHQWKKVGLISVIGICCVASVYLFGAWRLNAVSDTAGNFGRKARIVQANIAQSEKMDRNLAMQNLQRHICLSLGTGRVDFVIWPEACIPYLYKSNAENLNRLLSSAVNLGAFLIAGAVREDLESGKVYNSAIVVDSYGNCIDHYDKSRLVPFGEYVPFRRLLSFSSLASDVGDFDRGESARIVDVSGLKIAFAICYEAVFPREFLPAGGQVDVIINLTNDAWFAGSIQPYQHLQIVRARSIEAGVPLIRVTNFGISAVYDAVGREIVSVPIDTAGSVDFDIPNRLPLTPYGRFGDVIYFAMMLVAILFVRRRSMVVW